MQNHVNALVSRDPSAGSIEAESRRESPADTRLRTAVYTQLPQQPPQLVDRPGWAQQQHAMGAHDAASTTPLGKAVGFLAAEQPPGAPLRAAGALVVLAAIAVRCAVGLHPYSGAGKPPMYGDFEAQRHWMEITTSLPLGDWYRNTEQNDLQYWGLDYPPLTAYHSWVCGKVLGWLDPASMELTASRGYETPGNKTAMRAAALVRSTRLRSLLSLHPREATGLARRSLLRAARHDADRRRAALLPGRLRFRCLVLPRGLQPRAAVDRRSRADAASFAPDRSRPLPVQCDVPGPPRSRPGAARPAQQQRHVPVIRRIRRGGDGAHLPRSGTHPPGLHPAAVPHTNTHTHFTAETASSLLYDDPLPILRTP